MYLCQQYEFFSEEGKQRLAEYGKKQFENAGKNRLTDVSSR